MRKGHEQMWTLSLEWRSFPLSPCSWLWEKHKTLWRFETNHLEWETENQKPQQKRRVCKEFVRTTGVDYCVSRNWKNHLRCWKGGVSFWMWPMEEIKSKSYQRFVNLNTLLNVAEYWKKTKHKTYFKFASSVQFSSIQFSCSVVSDSLRPHELQHSRPPCPSPTPGVHSKSCPLSRWCHPTISSSVIPFSFHLQSFPASGFFQMSQFFASGGQSIGASASASVLPMNIQNWFPLRWTG